MDLLASEALGATYEESEEEATDYDDYATAYEKAIAYEEALTAFRRARKSRAIVRFRLRRKGRPSSWAENGYCVARHRMMVALLAVEDGSVSALVRKVGYMSLAELPPEMDSDSVLYYRAYEKIHLFYGGGLSPIGEGESPDGSGHGHVVLVKSGGGEYQVEYHRMPSG